MRPPPPPVPPPRLPPLPQKKREENIFDSLYPSNKSFHLSTVTSIPHSDQITFTDEYPTQVYHSIFEERIEPNVLSPFEEDQESILDSNAIPYSFNSRFDSKRTIDSISQISMETNRLKETYFSPFPYNERPTTPPSNSPLQFISPLKDFQKFYKLDLTSSDSLDLIDSSRYVDNHFTTHSNTNGKSSFPEYSIVPPEEKEITVTIAQDLPNLPVSLPKLNLADFDEIMGGFGIAQWTFHGFFDFGLQVYLFDSLLLIHSNTSFHAIKYEYCTIQLYGTPSSTYSAHVYDSLHHKEHILRAQTSSALELMKFTKDINILVNSVSDRNRLFCNRLKIEVISNNQIALDTKREVDPFLSPKNPILSILRDQSFEIKDPYVASINVFKEFQYADHMFHILGGSNGIFMRESNLKELPWKKSLFFTNVTQLHIYKNILLILTKVGKLVLQSLENLVQIYNNETKVAQVYDLIESHTIYHVDHIGSFVYISCMTCDGEYQLLQLQEDPFPSEFPMFRVRREIPVKGPIHGFKSLEDGNIIGLTQDGFIEINLDRCLSISFPSLDTFDKVDESIRIVHLSTSPSSSRPAVLISRISDSLYLLVYAKCAILLNRYHQPVASTILEFDLDIVEAFYYERTGNLVVISDGCCQFWTLNIQKEGCSCAVLWQKEVSYTAKNMKLLDREGEELILRFNHPYFTREMSETELNDCKYTANYDKSMPQLILKLDIL